MITRLKITGFKNLNHTEVHFGAFTCIAGANAVGKSNLFDAIRFLSYLADLPLLEAARSVRSEENRNAEVSSLFRRTASGLHRRMEFEVDMLIPDTGRDDLGQTATATITSLRYRLGIRLNPDPLGADGLLEILYEELLPIQLREARKAIHFDAASEWKKSAIKGRRNTELISTETSPEGQTFIRLHLDGQKGNLLKRDARQLPRTVLSTVDATQYPTALLARMEMRAWQLLQLEPSALRQSDSFDDFRQLQGVRLDGHGRYLPATLYRLARQAGEQQVDGDIYQRLANRLAELIDDVRHLSVKKDDQRQLLTLYLTGKDGAAHPARSLSDGTLRFLGLGVIELDPDFQGVICLEEPENGVHPEKIPAMLRLLQDIACDPQEPVDRDNPLRQVIINTHSPVVVQNIPEDAIILLTAEPDLLSNGAGGRIPVFHALEQTWRMEGEIANYYKPLRLGEVMAYLSQGKWGLNSVAEDQKPYHSCAHDRSLAAGRCASDPDSSRQSLR